MNPSDLDVLYVLGRLESEITNDVGLDLLWHIRCLEDYEGRLTPEDKRFLHTLCIAE